VERFNAIKMDRRTFLGSTVVLTTPLIAGCNDSGGGDGDDEGDGDGSGDADTTITIQEDAFDPQRLEVDESATVEWVNESDTDHTIVSGRFRDESEEWDLELGIESGSSGAHSFESAGIYEYHCDIHGAQSMCGVVLVGGASMEGDLPCE
jgi:plastocyanin